MALGPGSIAFVGFNADGNDNIAFVALETLPAGTVIFFQDNEWSGTAFNTGESAWSWSTTVDVPAGTVIRIDNIGGALATDITASAGTATFVDASNRGLSSGDEIVYAFVGTNATTPSTFLTAFASNSLTSGASLDGTGLTAGVNAMSFGVASGADIAAFNGARNDQASFAGYASIINNPANWIFQDGSGDQSIDTIAPDVPFSSTAFTVTGTETQDVAFAAGSLAVSVLEGDTGTTGLSFTVERTGGTTGEVTFTAMLSAGNTDTADFAGNPVLPITINGTIAAGTSSSVVTIDVAGDTAIELNESFTLTLQSASNADAAVTTTLGANVLATGTILDDDAPTLGGIRILTAAESLQGAAASPVATDAVTLLRLGAFTPTTGNSEVVGYDAATARMFVMNPNANQLDIVQIEASGSLTPVAGVDLSTLADYGAATTVSVKNGIVAVGIDSATEGAAGHVALFDTNGTFILQLDVGIGPDSLTFTPDGTRILVANEAEPGDTVPLTVGSVSIIDVSGGAAAASVINTISFSALNGFEDQLRAAGILVFPGQTAAHDIEPEYIAVSPDGRFAYVTLQEVNAVAVIDLDDPAASAPISILPLGAIDRSLPGNVLDTSDQDGGINIDVAPIFGLPQPDAIASFAVAGVTYFITANEGDSRVGLTDSVRFGNASYVLDPTAFPDAAALKANADLGRLNVLTNVGDTDGDGDFDQIYALGGRGFSIFRQNDDGSITKVRETGGEFERIIAARPDAATTFNQNQAGGTFDNRSDDKGPEPEGVDVGTINGRHYAFVALERQGGVMIYDVTDPANAFFVSYVPPAANDHGPEVVRFIAAADSPTGTALLLSANEVSGTTTIYAALSDDLPQQVRFAAGSLAVAQAEGNAGTSQMTFTVERVNGMLGQVDFTVQLAAGSAGSADFAGSPALPMVINGSIAAGQASTTITVDVAGDTVFEANETFTLTIQSVTNLLAGITVEVATTQSSATGTILNDEAPTFIGQVQGEGHVSPIVGQIVTLEGVVTAVDTNGSRGFYIQDGGDGNAATSDGIFVFLPTGTLPTVGNAVRVTGTVGEFIPNGAAPSAFSTTQLASVTNVTDLGVGTPVTPTVIGGSAGLLPPTEDLAAGGLFYERLEGMLVTVASPVAVGPRNSFGEIFTVVDSDNDPSNGLHATGMTPRGNLLITPGTGVFGDNATTGGDYNPERIQIDDDSGVLPGFSTPTVDLGARLNDVTGILRYDFGNYEVVATKAYTVAQPGTLVKETTTLAGGADKLTVAAYNAENLDPGDGVGRFATIGGEIVNRLLSPDIIALQEVQDNDGATNSATIAANVTLQMLVDAVAAAGGPTYAFVDHPFIGDDTNGGQPGGNIRNAYLYRTDRVDFVEGSLKTIGPDGSALATSYIDQQTNPDNPFFDSRPPLVATFTFNATPVTVVNNHFTSKGGSAPLLGSDQPPLNNGEVQRAAQAQAVNDFVDDALDLNPHARVVVIGDFNEFPWEEPMQVLVGSASITNYDVPGTNPSVATATFTAGGIPVLTDLVTTLPAHEQYDYIFDGNSQTLDHILVVNNVAATTEYDVVRINAEFADQTSDHEPIIAQLTIPTFSLANYVRIGRYDLPEPTRTTAPPGNLLAQEVSAVTYNWDTGTLFVLGDGGTAIVQVSTTGQLIDTMTLAAGSSPQGTAFYDPEGLAYVGGGKFVMVEERDRQAVQFTYDAGTTLTRAAAQTVQLGTSVGNVGLEGLTYDPETDGFIFAKETTPQGVFQSDIDFDAGTASNGSPSTVTPTPLFDPDPLGLGDLADLYALSNVAAFDGTARSSHILLLSQASGQIVEVDRAGNLFSTLTILSDPGNPLSVPDQQHEGLAMGPDGTIYVVSENGGGSFDNPQLWVYAPSSLPNTAPTALLLENQVASIIENASTATRVKVANVVVVDDGLGANALSVSGADAAFFEVDSTGLFIKAGTVIDFETKTSYAITVTVDDPTVGASPDATANFTLSVSDVVNENPAAGTLYISEIAPWSSGNSPVGADWFEVTNTGSSAIDITGWKYDDNSNSFASSVALNGITSIGAGESVIFIEAADPATIVPTFLDNWFGANAPAGLRIGTYSGSGVGLSTGGDAVNLFDETGVRQASVTFGPSSTGPFQSFNNAAGLDNTTITELSVVGTNGGFAAVNSPTEIGSPGTIGRIFISEVAPWSSGDSPIGFDWFEVTNTSPFAVDITGWKMDDSSGSPAAAVLLNGIDTIAPGESVIFIETSDPTKPDAFLTHWFGASPPATLQIGTYAGAGVGLGSGGDAIHLYDAGNGLRASVTFGASPTPPNLPTFDNAAAMNAATISTLSTIGTNGAFAAAAVVTEVGSPGRIIAPPYTLQILHFYGESGTLGIETAPIMGAMIDHFRSATANTLLLGEGDTWIPGPWLVAGADPSLSAVPGIGSTALARPDIAIFNAFGVDASALGNHEFDLGSAVVSGAIGASGSWVGAQFPFITSNLDFSADSALRGLADATLGGTATNNFAGKEASSIKGKIAPYSVVTVNGEKIGIVGSTTFELLSKTSPNGTVPKDDGNPATDDLQEVAALLQASVDALRATGVNKIVMVDQLDSLERNKLLAPMVSGIDVMVAGGGHERMGDANDVAVAFNGHDADFIADSFPIMATDKDGNPTLIVTTDTEFTYLGRLQVEFDAAGILNTAALDDVINGAYASSEAILQSVTGSSQSAAEIVAASATGAKVQAIVDAIDTVITVKDGNKFGFSNVYLEGDRVFGRAQEVNLGNLTADANAFKALTALGGGTMVSLKNGGGLRASIGSVEADGDKVANPLTANGNVSQLDVENALRFDNRLMVFDTTPQGLLNIMNFGAGLAPGNGGFPQVGGLRFSYDPDLAAGSRVQDIALYDQDGNFIQVIVNDGVVDANAPATIPVVILNFTANGGDGYPIKANGENFRYLLTDGTLSAPVDESLDFTAVANVPANALGEQKALQDFMLANHGTPETAYDQAETPAALDLRIQNLNVVASDTVICFAEGTRIATPSGPVAVEDLREGDEVEVLLGEGTRPIIWIGHRQVDCRRHPEPAKVWPVRVKAGAFGPGMPVRDLYLSPDHAVYVERVLIPIKHLINGGSVAQVETDTVTYYHVELASHDVVLAEGLAAESYLDAGDRANFSNAEGVVRLFPDFSGTHASPMFWEAFGCAPLRIVGPEVDAVRALLAERKTTRTRKSRSVRGGGKRAAA